MESSTLAQALDSFRSLPDAFAFMAQKFPDRDIYRLIIRSESGPRFISLNYRAVSERIEKIAQYLHSVQVKPGDRVAILSNTRPEWLEIDLAILSIGAITVSVYHSIPATEVGYILWDSGAKVVFCENEEQTNKILSLTKEKFKIPAREDSEESLVSLSINHIASIEAVSEHPDVVELDTIFEDDSLPLKPILPDGLITRDSIAALVYTSGTTGPPKGVIQTHGNHLTNIRQALLSGMFAPEGTLFLFLPLAHAFARLIGYLGFFTPAILHFPSIASTTKSIVDLGRVAEDMQFSNAHVVPAVPRLFEKIKSKIEAQSNRKNIKGILLKLMLQSARKTFQSSREGKATDTVTQLLYAGMAPLRAKVKHQIFGSHFLHAISGGAKLPTDVNEFFEMLSIPIFEGYGLTETVVATNVNRTNQKKIGSVGPVLDKVEVKIAEDGEILFRGANISPGYYNRPKATAESWKDGWFHTGDIGHIDSEGFLFITDRKKDLIVTAGGKKIPPQELEVALKESPFISQAIVLGDGKPFIVALLTPDVLGFQSIGIDDPFSSTTDTRNILSGELQKVNMNRASFETIKDFRVLPEELSIENGFLTPTLKIKRKVVMDAYRELIDDMYKGKSPRSE